MPTEVREQKGSGIPACQIKGLSRFTRLSALYFYMPYIFHTFYRPYNETHHRPKGTAMRKAKRAVHMQFVDAIQETPAQPQPVIDAEDTILAAESAANSIIRTGTIAVIAYVAADTLRKVLLSKLS